MNFQDQEHGNKKAGAEGSVDSKEEDAGDCIIPITLVDVVGGY